LTPDPALLVGVAGAAIVIAVLLTMYMSASQKAQDKSGTRSELNTRLAALQRVNPASVLDIQKKIASVEQDRIKAVEGALSFRVPWDYILAQVSRARPVGVQLTSLTMSSPASPDPNSISAPAAGTTAVNLQMSGWTYAMESVAMLMKRLSVLRPLSNVALISSSLVPGQQGLRPFYQFTVTAQVSQPGQASS